MSFYEAYQFKPQTDEIAIEEAVAAAELNIVNSYQWLYVVGVRTALSHCGLNERINELINAWLTSYANE